MKTITYTFADGTTDTVEVTDEVHAIHEEMEKANALSERRHHRMSYSLEQAMNNGWDVADPRVDVLSDVEKHERYAKLYAAIATLTPAQQLLIKKIFWEGKTQTEISQEEKVTFTAVHRRLQRILDKLRGILQSHR